MVEVMTATVPRRTELPGSAERADMSSLGGRLSFARLRSRLTQAELAKNLDKSRATVVQYEQNNIKPPIDVVEGMAKLLGVSPSFLAYGEATVPGLSKQTVEMVTFAERRAGKDGTYVDSAFAFNKDVVDHFGVEPDQIEAFVIQHDAPEFGLKTGDRAFIDKSITETASGRDIFLLKTQQGVEIVRVEPDFTAKSGNQIKMTGPKGQSFSAKASDLTFLGAVVGTLRKQ